MSGIDWPKVLPDRINKRVQIEIRRKAGVRCLTRAGVWGVAEEFTGLRIALFHRGKSLVAHLPGGRVLRSPVRSGTCIRTPHV